MAGTENVSIALQWLIAFMVNYPEVQDRCRDTIKDVSCLTFGILIHFSILLPCNYQLSKSIVHEIKFGDITGYSSHVKLNNLPYSDRYFNTDWQFFLRCLKEGSQRT